MSRHYASGAEVNVCTFPCVRDLQAFAFLQRMSVMFNQAEDGYVYMLLEDTRGKAFLLAPKDPMGGVRMYSLAALVSGLFAGDVDFRGHALYGLQLMRPKVGSLLF